MQATKTLSRTSTPPGIPIPRNFEQNAIEPISVPIPSKPPTEASDMPNCLKDLLDSYDLAHHKSKLAIFYLKAIILTIVLDNDEPNPLFHKLMLETSFNTIPDLLDVEP
jgi:hypothetical protein